MGAKLSKDEVLVTVTFDHIQEWIYSSEKPLGRIKIEKHDAEWYGLFKNPGFVDVEIEHDQDTSILVRIRIYKRRDGKWTLRTDKIYNLYRKYFFSLPGWKINENGVYRVHIEVYTNKNKVLNENFSFEICG